MTKTTSEALMLLAERCLAAPGPNFRLDQEIWAAAVAIPPANLDCVGQIKPPAYTASLDAAMMLYLRVPERVPSNPREAAAEALHQRAEAACRSALSPSPAGGE